MRYSADSTDPGYAAWVDMILQQRGGDISLLTYCDGRLLDHVVTADDALGYALVLDLDHKGLPQGDADGETKRRVIRGKITFAFGKRPERKRLPVDLFALNREFSS